MSDHIIYTNQTSQVPNLVLNLSIVGQLQEHFHIKGFQMCLWHAVRLPQRHERPYAVGPPDGTIRTDGPMVGQEF